MKTTVFALLLVLAPMQAFASAILLDDRRYVSARAFDTRSSPYPGDSSYIPVPSTGVPWVESTSVSYEGVNGSGSQDSRFLNQSGSTFDGFTASGTFAASLPSSLYETHFAYGQSHVVFDFQLTTPHGFFLSAADDFSWGHHSSTVRLNKDDGAGGEILVSQYHLVPFAIDLTAGTYTFLMYGTAKVGQPVHGFDTNVSESYDFTIQLSETSVPVPEPGTLGLLAACLLGLGFMRRSTRQAH